MRKLVVELYRVEDLNERFRDRVPGHNDFPRFVNLGNFIDGSVLQEHYYPRPEKILTPLDSLGCKVITMLRDPYDAFVSYYHYVNQMPDIFQNGPESAMIGQPIGHPHVIRYLCTDYKNRIRLSAMWKRSGRSLLVRYEDLATNPFGTLKWFTGAIAAVPDSRILRAIDATTAQRMRELGGWIGKHVRVASPGDWENHLDLRHLKAFRENYGALIRYIGYQVR